MLDEAQRLSKEFENPEYPREKLNIKYELGLLQSTENRRGI
jgi:hypothetical protein